MGQGQRKPTSRSTGQVATRRSVLKSAAALVTASLAAPFLARSAKAAEKLVVYNGWGGSFDDALFDAFFKPFQAETGIEVQAFKPQSFALLKKQVDTGVYQFDFADYNSVRATQAKLAGLLEEVDFSIVEKDKLEPLALESAESVSGIAFSSLALTLTYNKKKFPNGGPQSWADFWNVEKFPGNRGFMQGSAADRMIAAALLADGVPKDKLYPLDLDRGFRKLDELKPHLKVIWKGGSQGMQLLRDEEVDMSPIWTGRAWQLVDDGVPLEIVWNEGFYSTSNWIVAKGTPRRENAWRLINYTNDAKRMAKFTELANNGPILAKAFDYLDEKHARRVPTYPANWRVGIVQQAAWTGEHLDEITKRYNQWLAT